jgi:regulatory protein
MEDGKRLSLYRQTVEDFGLYAGMELTVEQFLQIEEANGAVSAKMRAVRIVAASSVSKKDLQQRLIQKGEDPDHAADAVAWMEEMHLVDDEETARQIVSRCAARGYGLSRAKQALYEKKVPKRYWNAALADFPDQTEHIIAFLRTKIRNYADDRETKKAIDALLRRGHSYSQIRTAMRCMDMDAEEFPED